MAALADVTAVTGELLESTRELRRDLTSGDADFKTLAFLADAIAERADVLATTFDAIDAALLEGLPVAQPVSDPAAETAADAAAPQAEAEAPASQADRRSWLASLLRPARWLGRRLRDAWQVFGSRAPSERAEFA